MFSPKASHEQTLLRQSQKLTAAWERFIEKLPKEERANVRDKPPSLATLFNTVDEAQQKLNKKKDETKLGRFKGIFGDLCRSFDDYKVISFRGRRLRPTYLATLLGSIWNDTIG